MATTHWVCDPCFFFFQSVLTLKCYTAPTVPGQVDIPVPSAVHFHTLSPPPQSLTTSFSPTPATPAANSSLRSWARRIAGPRDGPVSLTTNWAASRCISDIACWSRMVILRRSLYTVNSQTIGKILAASSLGLVILLRIRNSFRMGLSVSSSKAATFTNCRHRGIRKRESESIFDIVVFLVHPQVKILDFLLTSARHPISLRSLRLS